MNVCEPVARRRPCGIGIYLGSLRQLPEAAAVLGHRVELEVARAIAGERDRAGRRPRGLTVVRRIRREAGGDAAGGGYDVEFLVAVAQALEHQACPVRRPRGVAVPRGIEGDACLGAAVRVVDVDLLVAVPCVREREAAPSGAHAGSPFWGPSMTPARSPVPSPFTVATATVDRALALHRDPAVRAREGGRGRLRYNRQEYGRRGQHTLHTPTVFRSGGRCNRLTRSGAGERS